MNFVQKLISLQTTLLHPTAESQKLGFLVFYQMSQTNVAEIYDKY